MDLRYSVYSVLMLLINEVLPALHVINEHRAEVDIEQVLFGERWPLRGVVHISEMHRPIRMCNGNSGHTDQVSAFFHQPLSVFGSPNRTRRNERNMLWNDSQQSVLVRLAPFSSPCDALEHIPAGDVEHIDVHLRREFL